MFDSSLFVYKHGNDVMMVLLYVDDIVLTGSNSGLLSCLISALNTNFSMKDLGSLHYFLGIEVTHTPQGLLLSQSKYAKPMATPMSVKCIFDSCDLDPYLDPTHYRSIVGAL